MSPSDLTKKGPSTKPQHVPNELAKAAKAVAVFRWYSGNHIALCEKRAFSLKKKGKRRGDLGFNYLSLLGGPITIGPAMAFNIWPI